LRTLNMAWLLTIVLNPFATKLLTSQGHQPLGVHALRFGFYALVQALSSGTLLALSQHMVTHAQVPSMPASLVTSTNWESVGLLVGFGLSMPVFFATAYGWVLWFVGPLVVRQVHRLRHGTPKPRPA
jgi:hypothetical protein